MRLSQVRTTKKKSLFHAQTLSDACTPGQSPPPRVSQRFWRVSGLYDHELNTANRKLHASPQVTIYTSQPASPSSALNYHAVSPCMSQNVQVKRKRTRTLEHAPQGAVSGAISNASGGVSPGMFLDNDADPIIGEMLARQSALLHGNLIDSHFTDDSGNRTLPHTCLLYTSRCV